MKKKWGILFVLFLGLAALWGAVSKSQGQVEQTNLKIGVITYKSNDTFVESIVTAMEQKARQMEQETGIRITLDLSSAQESQRTQNSQVERYLSLGYDVICVNLVDRTDANTVVDLATSAQVPVIFFNREPVKEDLTRSDAIYYVGTRAEETGRAQGELAAEAFLDGRIEDKNQDGILQYVMLEGEMGHQDAIIRTEESVQVLKESGIATQLLASAVGNWERSQGAALMEQWLNQQLPIELVLSNNDDMALGALDALQKAGVTVPVIGIDGTEEGKEAVEDGRLLATVDCNGQAQGEAIFSLAAALAQGEAIPSQWEVEEDHYLWVSIDKMTDE